MATEEHGVRVNLRTNLSEALKKAAGAAGEARAAIGHVGNAAGSAFSKAGAAVVVMNQGLELAKKGIEVFRATIGATIETSLNFRKEGDKTTAFFKDFKRETELVSARIGDTLLPVFQGFIEATQAATGKISDLIEENRKLVGGKLIDWIGGAAKLFVSVLARAIEYVGKIFLGWKEIIGLVQIAFNEYFAFVLRGLSFFLDKLSTVADFLGAKGLAKAVRSAQLSVSGLGDEFKSSSEKAQTELGATANDIGKLEKTIAKVEGIVKSVIDDGMVRAQKHVSEAAKGTNRTLDEQKARHDEITAAIEKQKTAIDKLRDSRIADIDAAAKQFEADAKAIDARQQALAANENGPGLGAQLGGQVASNAGAAGNIAGGFASGGWVGGIVSAAGELLQNSKSIQRTFEVVNKVLTNLFDALEPLLIAVEPLTILLTEALNPVIEQLAKVLNGVATVILDVIEGIAKAWNGIVSAITWVFKKLGDISIFGKHPLGFIKDWAEGIERRAMISTDEFDRARDRLINGWKESADTVADGASTIRETVDDMQREMVGIPQLLKVSLHEFRAAEGATAGTQVGVGGVATAGSNGMNSGTTIITNSINMHGVTDIRDMIAQIDREAAFNGVVQNGTLSAAVATGTAGRHVHGGA